MPLKRKIEEEGLRNSNYRIVDLIKIGKRIINGIKNPYFEIETIIRHHLSLSKEEFILKLNEEISEKKVKEIVSKFYERREGKPLSYITGEREFLSRKFIVFENVFIPRYETEEIVYHILKEERIFNNCLDICAGTGVIGITLLIEGKVKRCTFVDIDPLAIENIKANLKRFKVNGKVIKSDMFDEVEGEFDLIISNPPYIPEDMIKELDEDVKREPITALNGGKDGLKFIKVLLKEGGKYLKKGGLLIFEYPLFLIDDFTSLSKELKLIKRIDTFSQDIKGVVFTKL